VFIEIDNKSPVMIIYAKEGTPFVTSPSAIFAQAPHPNAARLFENFIFTAKAQQLTVDKGGTRSVHPDVKEPANRTALSQIKLLPDDPAPHLVDAQKPAPSQGIDEGGLSTARASGNHVEVTSFQSHEFFPVESSSLTGGRGYALVRAKGGTRLTRQRNRASAESPG